MSQFRNRYFSWYLIKYLSADVLFTFLSGASLFLLIMLMFQAIRLSEFVVVHQVSFQDVGRLCLYLMLSFLPIAIPIAFLFAVLMGVSRANSEGELLAMQANGISLKQVFAPILLFSFLVSVASAYTSLYSVPRGNRKFELLITKLASERVMAALKPGVFFDGFKGLTLFAEQVFPLRNEMKRVFLYDARDETWPLAITAEEGILKNLPDQGGFSLRLSKGTIHIDVRPGAPVKANVTSKRDESGLQLIDFDIYDINMDGSATGDSWRDYSPPSYTFPQLKQRIQETTHDLPLNRQLQVELHRRFSLSFACMVFAVLGFAIGILSQRGVRSTAILLCLFVGLLYWLTYIACTAVAVNGWIVPWLGIWLPNFFFLICSYFAYRRYGT